ncbi:MAG: hypothetical protein QOG64_1914 [Acidimicrobiaceae bacterium]|nr:hypothetical protein [Acidimicrobiaceae bacterium]
MTDPAPLSDRAERLRRLHDGPNLLVLPNAWDATSARLFEAKGFPAIATTSGGVANAVGYDDGEAIPPDEMFAAVARITRSVSVPVTADIEAGYGLPPEELVERLLAAGAVGCNIEDSDHRRPGQLLDAGSQADRLAAIKAAGRSAGVDLVVNARIDVHVRGIGAPEDRLPEALRRAARYRAAGADCLYPITMRDEESIAAFVAGAGGPVNIYLSPSDPPLGRMAELGVRRVTFGGNLARAAMKTVEDLVDRW